MANWFERLTLGDPRRADFRKEDLPDTRRQLFWDVLKVRLWKMIGLNGLWLLFSVPAIIWIMITAILLTQQINDAGSAAAIFNTVIVPTLQTFLLIMIPLGVISGIGKAGMSHVINQWAYDDNAWTWDGFWEGVKLHWRQSLLARLVNGIVWLILITAFLFYSGNSAYFTQQGSGALFYSLGSWFMLCLMLIFWMVGQYIWPLMTTYKMKFSYLYRNAFVLSLGRLPETLLVCLGQFLLPAAFYFLGGNIMVMGNFIYVSLIGAVWGQFLASSYAHNAFDRYINRHIKGAVVNRGLTSVYTVE